MQKVYVLVEYGIFSNWDDGDIIHGVFNSVDKAINYFKENCTDIEMPEEIINLTDFNIFYDGSWEIAEFVVE